jgi:5-carboxymethyl-2-hydroxymuconate isomerase
MPHLNIEYSANLDDVLDIQALVDRIHDTALDTGIFPLGGVRTRAEARTHYRIANGDPDAGYIHMMVRHEISPDMAWRKNNLHELLKKEAGQ